MTAAACSAFTADDEAGPLAESGSPDGLVAADGPDATASDAAAGCPNGRGPAMLLVPAGGGVGAYCIDTTEVTQEHYQPFLDDGQKPPKNGAECNSSSSTFFPGCNFNPSATPQHPVACVDWCDARAYCAWAGKRLCGLLPGVQDGGFGGSVPAAQLEWSDACSRRGGRPYPWGADADAGGCNYLKDGGPTGVVPVKSRSECIGGFDGLHDMGGNVQEWLGICNATYCRAPGGGFDTNAEIAKRCDNAFGTVKDERKPQTGFRCCADVR
jgi:formylglycine-generating enzyme